MAINIIREPAFISPSGNPMMFYLEDTNPLTTFIRATIREVGTGDVIGVTKVFRTPETDGNFVDVARRLKDYTRIEIDNSSNLYEGIEGAIHYNVEFRSIDQFGETVGAPVMSGDKWAISGGGDILNGYNYDVTDWYMDINTIGVKYADFLTSRPLISDIFLFQKEFLYFLADENSGIETVKIDFYTRDGSLIDSVVEPVNVAGEGQILNRLYIQPNLLATVYDFDVSQLYRMEVALYGASDIRISKVRTFLVDPRYDCSVDKVNLLWENYEGGVDTYTFINPRETKTATRQTMLLNGYSESINNVFENLSQVVSSSVESTYRLTSLGLTEEMYKALSNMIGTENAYVELGNGALWGVVLDNTTVEVKRRKYETGLLRFDIQFKSIPNLDIINRGSVLIEDDLMPNPIVFNDVTEANFSQTYTSNTVQITGINVTVPISITGGQYRVNNGVWTTQNSIVNNGDTVTVRLTTAQASEYTYTVVLTVGEGQGVWNVTTKEILSVPDTISFTPLNDTELNTPQNSNTVVITGINISIPVSVSGGSYSKNGGQGSTAPTTAVNGDTFALRHTSATVGETPTTTVFNYGGKSANFITTTREYDIIPDDFTFSNIQNAPVNSEQLSNIITVNGITDPIPISITSGSYRINGGAWVSTSGSVVQGDTVQLRLVAPANAGQNTSTTLTIGNKSASWNVDTTEPDIVPNPFNFTPNPTGVARNSYINSNVITVSGINVGSPIQLTAGASWTQYRINGGAWTSSSGTVFNGDTVQLRIQSSTAYSNTRSATLSIGGVTDAWSVTTLLEPSVSLETCAVQDFGTSYRVRAYLTFSPTNTTISQSITVSGQIRYLDSNSIPQSVPFSMTIPAGTGTNNITSSAYSLFGAQPGSVYTDSVTSNPSNGQNINTASGSRKLNTPSGGGSCI